MHPAAERHASKPEQSNPFVVNTIQLSSLHRPPLSTRKVSGNLIIEPETAPS
jgi:hypothetical protein